MTRIEYDLVRADRPDLKLPHYAELRDEDRDKVAKLIDRDALISARCYTLLRRDFGVLDPLRHPSESIDKEVLMARVLNNLTKPQ